MVGLEGFEVVDSTYDESGDVPTARLRLDGSDEEGPWVCGDCAQVVETGYDRQRYDVLDLPYGKWKRTVLDVPKVRVTCPDCGVRQQALSAIETNRGYTTRLKNEVAQACRGLRSLTDVAGGYPLSWHQVRAIDEWYVRTQRCPVDWKRIECIGIDEFSLKKGHEYATRVMDLTDPEDDRTIWVGRHRKAATLEAFYEQMAINRADPSRLEAVCVDDWDPYKKATRQYAPQAQIVQDPFHLIRRMNTVMGSVRNRLKNNGDEQTKEALKGTKRLLEAAVEDVSEEAEDRLESLFNEVPEMGTVHRLKEQLRRLWDQPDRQAGREYFEDWVRQANESGISEMKEFARKLARKQEEIVAGCEYDLNTSVVEGFNNRTKTLQNVAFGFRDHQYYFLKIMAVQTGGSRADPY